MRSINLTIRTYLLIGLIILVSSPAYAVPDAFWEETIPSRPKPSGRAHLAAAYDSSHNEVVVFGGFSATRLGDTWVWNGSGWADVSPPPELSPPARFRHSMTFDSVRNVVVLYGGSGDAGRLNDTWEWDGRTWTNKTPDTTNNPPIRDSAALAFDSIRNRTVLFGGFKGGSPANYQDTWEWDGTSWTQVFPTESPSARNSMGMTFQEDQGRVVLFGGFDTERRNDTWTYDGITWQMLPRSPTSPPVRNYHTLVFDKFSEGSPDRVLLFGGLNTGSNYLNDTWQLIGNNWSKLTTSNTPIPRCCFGLAFDSLQLQMVLFGGAGGGGDLSALDDLHLFTDPPPVPTPTPTLSTEEFDRNQNKIALD